MEKNNIIEINGSFGFYIDKVIEKLIGTIRRKALFISLSNFTIKFYSIFIPEVIETLEVIGKDVSFGINKSGIKDVIAKIKSIANEGIMPNIDLKKIKEVSKFDILPHQQPVFDNYPKIIKEYGYRGILLFGAAGIGKTFISLMLSEALGSDRVIIVAPNPTIFKVWVYAVTEELYKKRQEYCFINQDKFTGQKFIICNYENISKLIDIANEIKTNKTTLIVDESHNFADNKSSRTELLKTLINKIDSKNNLLLSGTPIKGKYVEIVNLVEILDPRLKDNKTLEAFKTFYKSPTEIYKKVLNERFGNFTTIVKKESIKLDPIETTYVKVTLGKNGNKYKLTSIKETLKKYILEAEKYYNSNMNIFNKLYYSEIMRVKPLLKSKGITEKDFNQYEDDVSDIIDAYKKKTLRFIPDVMKRANHFEDKVIRQAMTSDEFKRFKEAATITKYLFLKIQGEALANVILKHRIEAHRDMASAFNYNNIIDAAEKKTIIFSNYVEVCEASRRKVIDEKYNPITVYGSTVGDLTKNVTDFTKEKNINPLITTFKALSTGVPLVVANTIVIIDMPFRMYTYEQAIARVWRLGQDERVKVFILKLDTDGLPNINSRNIDIITFFKEAVEEITGQAINMEIDPENTGVIELGFKNILSQENYKVCKSFKLNKDYFKGWY